jgi:hypothetical protein
MAKKRVSQEEDPALSPEALRAAREHRIKCQTPPPIETLKAALKSRSLAKRIDAALWVVKFDTNPRVSPLTRPLAERAVKVIADATSLTTPKLSLEAAVDIHAEMLGYMYEKRGEFEPLTPEREAEAQKLALEFLESNPSAEEIRREFKPRLRRNRPVN